MIEHNDKQHLFPVCVQTLAETRNFLARLPADREAVSLLAKVDSVIARIRDSTRGPGRREATQEG